ncbi:P-loop containing nucleoside triphosphate hydrolase protein [Pyronema omphalodes]|nr:P-loop containing nucleoside triphosphate hydrolase protein [Pyronema omphalodes]
MYHTRNYARNGRQRGNPYRHRCPPSCGTSRQIYYTPPADTPDTPESSDSSAAAADTKPALPNILTISDYVPILKHLEQRHPPSSRYPIISEPLSEPPPRDTDDRFRQFILCSIRRFNNDDEYIGTSLQVKSPVLKKLLKEVVGNKYPGTSFTTGEIQIESPYRSLWHYLPELRDAVSEMPEDGVERRHGDYFLSFLDSEFEETEKKVENLFEQGLITYDLLWALFKPGEVVYTPANDTYPARCWKFMEGNYQCGQQPMYKLQQGYVTYDGTDFGVSTQQAGIAPFSGARKIVQLPIFPLSWHPQEEAVRKKLVARGRRFEELRGKQYCHYTGIALGEYDCSIGRMKKYAVNGPIMVDCEIFGRICPNRANNVEKKLRHMDAAKAAEEAAMAGKAGSEDNSDGDEYGYDYDDPSSYRPLTEDELLIAESVVHGFSFTQKRWVQFFIDLVNPPVWNSQAYSQLVLPAAQKTLIKALVETHVKGQSRFDDFISGKGRGLVAILHGPPGVGKTLTAESVAHAAKRPLYCVSSGELGTEASELEKNLAVILDMASSWKAVVLLDEADVFLEKRSEHDLKRNALVSIFLRLLEYYEGILFLTTNRVATFDEAFQSRIHVSLRYSDLDKNARRKVWGNFKEKVEGMELSDQDLETLAEYELNGREIKNAIGTAKTLADAEGEMLTVERLKIVLGIQMEFERDMKKGDL